MLLSCDNAEVRMLKNLLKSNNFADLGNSNLEVSRCVIETTMKVAIIGAGPAGLASARRAREYNVDCTVFEMTGNIGGTWVYYESSDSEETADSVRNPMYADLRTNLPIQLMEFPGFQFKPESGLCYPRHEEVRKYLEDFADEYELHSCIKLYCQVIDVSRRDDRWHLITKNLKHMSFEEYTFDGVMVCNGHWRKPFIPNIPGMDTFTGHLIHSRCYRRNERYEGKRVLIVGAAASGRDIAVECAAVANEIILSYGSKKCDLDGNIQTKPRTCSINGDEVFFADGTSATVDAIILCTGYLYDFPFLNQSCGVEVVEERIVSPLYKYLINITHPTMCFIGLLQLTVIFPLVDLQAEVFVKILTKKIRLPSTSAMLSSLDEENQRKLTAKGSEKHYFYLGAKVKDYFNDLAAYGEVKLPPPVIFKIYAENQRLMADSYKMLKNHVFEVIDDDTFVSRYEENLRI